MPQTPCGDRRFWLLAARWSALPQFGCQFWLACLCIVPWNGWGQPIVIPCGEATGMREVGGGRGSGSGSRRSRSVGCEWKKDECCEIGRKLNRARQRWVSGPAMDSAANIEQNVCEGAQVWFAASRNSNLETLTAKRFRSTINFGGTYFQQWAKMKTSCLKSPTFHE